MDEWVVWLNVEPFSLHLNRDMACTGIGKNGLCTHFLDPETVSGGLFQLYFNGFQVSSPGPRHSQCERFLHNIGLGFRSPLPDTASVITPLRFL